MLAFVRLGAYIASIVIFVVRMKFSSLCYFSCRMIYDFYSAIVICAGIPDYVYGFEISQIVCIYSRLCAYMFFYSKLGACITVLILLHIGFESVC
jgi:hypothetical protein